MRRPGRGRCNHLREVYSCADLAKDDVTTFGRFTRRAGAWLGQGRLQGRAARRRGGADGAGCKPRQHCRPVRQLFTQQGCRIDCTHPLIYHGDPRPRRDERQWVEKFGRFLRFLSLKTHLLVNDVHRWQKTRRSGKQGCRKTLSLPRMSGWPVEGCCWSAYGYLGYSPSLEFPMRRDKTTGSGKAPRG